MTKKKDDQCQGSAQHKKGWNKISFVHGVRWSTLVKDGIRSRQKYERKFQTKPNQHEKHASFATISIKNDQLSNI